MKNWESYIYAGIVLSRESFEERNTALEFIPHTVVNGENYVGADISAEAVLNCLSGLSSTSRLVKCQVTTASNSLNCENDSCCAEIALTKPRAVPRRLLRISTCREKNFADF